MCCHTHITDTPASCAWGICLGPHFGQLTAMSGCSFCASDQAKWHSRAQLACPEASLFFESQQERDSTGKKYMTSATSTAVGRTAGEWSPVSWEKRHHHCTVATHPALSMHHFICSTVIEPRDVMDTVLQTRGWKMCLQLKTKSMNGFIHSIFTEHLLYVRHCFRSWGYGNTCPPRGCALV